MNAGLLDTITGNFVNALLTATTALSSQYSLGLLAIFASITFYLHMGQLTMAGSLVTGDVLASFVLALVKIGTFFWLLTFLPHIGTAAFQTFLQWGMAASGNTVVAQRFNSPSLIVDLGFTTAKPLKQFIDHLSGTGNLFYFFTIQGYWVAYWLIVLAFLFVALHLMLTIIEYQLAVLAGTVLIPWGVLGPMAFFSEFSIGWITGGLVRVLATGAIVGLAVPLFNQVKFTQTGGGDPTWYSALVAAMTSFVFAILAWLVPGRAAAIAGRGVSLAIHGGALLAGAAGPLRGVIMVTTAIRGISSLVRRH